jgi:thiol-disulfide isomerase/thioredoxin
VKNVFNNKDMSQQIIDEVRMVMNNLPKLHDIDGLAPDSEELYDPSDKDVVVLTDQDIIGLGKTRINARKFKGSGYLKAYASWCPHCVAKVNCIKTIGSNLSELGQAIYVIDADVNNQFNELLKITGFPTFLEVDENGYIGQTVDFQAICNKFKKLTGYEPC